MTKLDSASDALFSHTGSGDGFLFSGNRHEVVPVALFRDRRLTPLERNAWQVFRLLLNGSGLTVFPTYDQFRIFLASMPGAQASHETVARVLTVLRLTRWLSLVRRRRDTKTGRIVGNVYVLHDEPLTPYEAIQLDPAYLTLTGHALTHASKTVRIVGQQVLSDLADDPMLRGRILPTRLTVLQQRLVQREVKNDPQNRVADSEEGSDIRLRNREAPSSESEDGSKPASGDLLRNPKTDSTVRSSSINKVLTTTVPVLHLPERFQQLKPIQQQGALAALSQIKPDERQVILNEWAARCRTQTIRSPAGYLFGIIQKALQGQFNAWASEETAPRQSSETVRAPPPETVNVANRETALRHLEQLKAQFKGVR